MSPPCASLGETQELEGHVAAEGHDDYNRKAKVAIHMVKFCLALAQAQVVAGRHFAIEAPKEASTWKLQMAQTFVRHISVQVVESQGHANELTNLPAVKETLSLQGRQHSPHLARSNFRAAVRQLSFDESTAPTYPMGEDAVDRRKVSMPAAPRRLHVNLGHTSRE